MAQKFNPHEYPICFTRPLRIAPHYWARHIPFAMFITDLLRPRVFVELGTYYGVSYCAFCQAVKELDLDTRCYAIDTWHGDGITWSYEASQVLDDLKQHHDPKYGRFSRLTQSTFDDALQGFRDGEIDLLHIDGYHPYESVKHDFESWLPKMSSRGVILFHDINVRQAEYGVWKLWDEIKSTYPHFELWHEHGLGVLLVGTNVPTRFTNLLIDSDDSTQKEIQKFFFDMGETWAALFNEQELKRQNNNLIAEIKKQASDLSQLQMEINNQANQLDQLQLEISLVKNSNTYNLAQKFIRLINFFAPPGTYQYRLLVAAKKRFF